MLKDAPDCPRGYVTSMPWYFRNQSQPLMAENGVTTTFGLNEIKPSQYPHQFSPADSRYVREHRLSSLSHRVHQLWGNFADVILQALLLTFCYQFCDFSLPQFAKFGLTLCNVISL